MLKGIFLIGFLTVLVAQAQKAVPEEKRIPFVFLNQYFSYEVAADNKFIISNKTIDFSKMTFDEGRKKVSINFVDVMKPNLTEYSVSFKDQNQKTIKSEVVPPSTSIKPVAAQFEIPETVQYVCLVSSNAFTRIEVCKQTIAKSQPHMVKVDGQAVEKLGTIVLKDNEKPLVFEARLSDENFFRMATKKRLFYPKTVQKEAQQDELKVRFVDTTVGKRIIWDDVIKPNQTSITVPNDSVINLKQDIFFVNSDVQKMAINYSAPEPAPVKETGKSKVAVKKPDVYITPDHQYVFEPFAAFLALSGNSPTLQANLVSDMGKGLKFSYRKRKSETEELQFNVMAYQVGISNDMNLSTIGNSSQLLFSTAVGWKYMYTDTLGFTPEVELKQDLFFKNTLGTPNVDIVSGLNKQVSANPFWIFYDSNHSQASLDLGVTFILPTSAGGLSVKSGYKYKYGATYQYRYPDGALLIGVSTGKRSQDFDDFKFSENFLIMSAGYSLYFQ
jgi:hypothetical protein